MALPLAHPRSKSLHLSLVTWAVVLLASDLTNALWQALLGEPPAWLFWAKAGLLLVMILAASVWKLNRPVRSFFVLLLVLVLALWSLNWIRGTAGYLQWEKSAGWITAMAAFQGLKLAVAAILAMVLFGLGKKREDFFLTLGRLKDPVRGRAGQAIPPARYLSWGQLGLILGICIAPLTLLFFGMGNLPSAGLLAKALPFFPVALLFAATNAFSEEVQFRAGLLGELQQAVGPEQALWLSSAFFGLAHYFGGAPSGILGVLIAGLLGALFAKCMLGSKGLLVPWFIHFCQNAVIYAFWAIGAVA